MGRFKAKETLHKQFLSGVYGGGSTSKTNIDMYSIFSSCLHDFSLVAGCKNVLQEKKSIHSQRKNLLDYLQYSYSYNKKNKYMTIFHVNHVKTSFIDQVLSCVIRLYENKHAIA